MSPPTGVRRRIYNEQERLVINPFKEGYMSAGTPAQRKNIAKELFSKLFSYWSSIGLDLETDESNRRQGVRTKIVKVSTLPTFYDLQVLIQWLRNVWRVRRNPVAKPGTRFRLTDILWWTRQDCVFEEIASILNIETANTSTPGWFQLRTKASKNIVDSMSEEERKVLEEEADRMQEQGLPQDVQRRCVPKQADVVREPAADL